MDIYNSRKVSGKRLKNLEILRLYLKHSHLQHISNVSGLWEWVNSTYVLAISTRTEQPTCPYFWHLSSPLMVLIVSQRLVKRRSETKIWTLSVHSSVRVLSDTSSLYSSQVLSKVKKGIVWHSLCETSCPPRTVHYW